MAFFTLLILAGVIWILWYVAKQFEEVAQQKGYTQEKYFWLCFLLGGIGYLLVIALPDRGNRGAAEPAPTDDLPDL